ncbi:MAG: hypothetical protein WCB70_21145 [Xanthobacteraceae bacterium]
MKDFERLMLAIYDATVESSTPFVSWRAMKDELRLDQEAMKALSFTLKQRGFLAEDVPGNNLALSATGIDYVQRHF